MKKTYRLMLLLGILLTSCIPGAGSAGPSAPTLDSRELATQAATIVAGALRQTETAQAALLPSPTSGGSAQDPSAGARFQSLVLGIQFDLPQGWHTQESGPEQPFTVTAASFDPAQPPHKLEWTDQTTSLQFHLVPVGSVPPTLDEWVEIARQQASSNHLEVFSEERMQIAGRPAAVVTLVSGSGGIIHQVFTVQDTRYYQIDIEGNLDLAKSLLATFQTLPLDGLKPADSDSPAAGICAETQDDPVTILLGTGPDGLPVGGRCVAIGAGQRILFINQADTEFHYKLPGLSIDLPAGQQFLLEKPAGSFFAPGVHFIPTGPELWVKEIGSSANPTQAATMPGPLRSYENPGLGYALTLPPGWKPDDTALQLILMSIRFI